MATNTAWGPWTYKDGFYYRIRWDGIRHWEWEVVDSAYNPVSGGSGSVMGTSLDYLLAITAAKDFIESHDDDEHFEEPEIGGVWKGYITDRCYTIETQNATLNAGIGKDLYLWRVKDINGAIIFTQSFPQEYNAATADAAGYLKSLPEQEGCVKGGGGGGNGLETDSDLLKMAGIFVVGVAKGTLTATIPIITMSVAVGFMKRIVRIGVGVGN